MTKGERKITIIVGSGLLLVILLYLNYSNPGKVIIDGNGKINGLNNIVREWLQGGVFWENQLKEANIWLKYNYDEPQRHAKAQNDFQQQIDEGVKEIDETMEEIYQKHPAARPSSAQQQAKALRDQADEIEWQEKRRQADHYINEHRLKRILELKTIITLIEVKLNTNTAQ